MTDKEFDRQYKYASSWTARVLNDLIEAEYFGSLPACELFAALCERIEESSDIEAGELAIILDEVAERLGQLEEMKTRLRASKRK